MILLVPEVWIISGGKILLEQRLVKDPRSLKKTKMMFTDGRRIFQKKR